MALTKVMVQTAFSAARSVAAGSVVTVASETESCNGMRGPRIGESDPSAFGENGTDSNYVRVSLAEFTEPNEGATITIDGNDVFVTGCREDDYKATLYIAYQKQRPLDDEDLV